MDTGKDREDQLHRNNSGYTMIELILVSAIIAIIMGMVFYSISLVFSANARSCANNIKRSISDCKVTTMGKADAYMLLYRDGDGTVYTRMYITESDGSITEEEPQKVGTGRVEVEYIVGEGAVEAGDTSVPLLPGDSIEIHFDRSNGGFKADAANNIYKAITVKGGRRNYSITMTKLTGKSEVTAVE